MAGECLGYLTQFAIDVRLPLPATCPDCGADVLARADIEEPFPPGRLAFNALRVRRAKTMTLRFIVGRILRELIELADTTRTWSWLTRWMFASPSSSNGRSA